ncbi:MAG: DUF3656 domain-containing protein [Coriobacteriia bacterium]|nr:DUF3656 domain-containing protein [Coriobacteriia bacterium]
MTGQKIELLAPAGDVTCLHAAVRAGADAVYLGAQEFNARRGAGNFTLDGLQDACHYAHLRGVRIYLTVNTVVLDSEMPAALELVRQAYRRGVDAFIVQDLGLARELSRTLPEAELHVSTQMNIHNVAGLVAASKLGAKRVTLARELALPELAELCAVARELNMDIEVFGHGALCICYSGQCLMSSLVGGRSANRGRCAQACRLPYELHNKAVRKPLNAPGEHLLSPKDLCTIDLIPQLIDAGVASLKIEGRMKSPEYVSAVVGVYRKLLDRVQQGTGREDATHEERRILSEAFSRGFTEAYLVGETGNDMMSYQRPNNRGVLVGRVDSARDGVVSVQVERPVQPGDVLEFWTARGHFAYTLVQADIASQRRLRISAPLKKVGKGDRVFRVRDAASAYVDDPLEPRVPVVGEVDLRIGEPLQITFRPAADASAEGTFTGDIVEPARTKPVSADDVRDHIDRMGTTPFSLASSDALAIELDEGVGMGFSQLHKARAAALEALEEAMAPTALRMLPRASEQPRPEAVHPKGCEVCVLTANPSCARAAKRAGADAIYVHALNYKRGTAMVGGQVTPTVEQAGYPKQAVLALPTIAHDDIDGTRERKFSFDALEAVRADKPVLVDNLGQLLEAQAKGALVEAGPHIPVLNRHALDELAELGVKRVWLSPELSMGQIGEIAKAKPASLGLYVSGAAELMVTEHCLLMSQGPCNRNCTECVRRKSPHFLKDRKGFEMPVVTDCCGRSHLYNAVSLDLTHLMPDLLAAGVDAVMVDATLLNVEETTASVRRAVRARDVALKSGDALKKIDGATTGHIFRGVD